MSKIIVYLLLAMIFVSACLPVQTQVSAQMIDPAAESCIKQGGKVEVKQRGNDWEYEICAFATGRQCETWAMTRGDCPIGGVETTGYHTPASRYCAITGGEYHLISNEGAEKEKGTCNFACGKSCDVWQYYNGRCGACVGK